MRETLLRGGDVNTVVLVGKTVRRSQGPWSTAVHALLTHFEREGVSATPRFLGVDDDGREILSYLEGDAGHAPVPAGDAVVFALGRLLQELHDSQVGFEQPPIEAWQAMVGAPRSGEVVCHNDLFWTNLIFRGEELVGIVDWDLAAPAPRLHDLASAARFWVPLRPDDQARAWGLPTERRRERLLALCEGYGLAQSDRHGLLDAVEERGRIAIATYHAWGRDQRLPGWAEMWDRDQDGYLVATQDWLSRHRNEIRQWLP